VLFNLSTTQRTGDAIVLLSERLMEASGPTLEVAYRFRHERIAGKAFDASNDAPPSRSATLDKIKSEAKPYDAAL
jgi:hypothetical protein